MADVKLAEATSAYDAELARTGVPAAAVFAAAAVLELPVADALNVLLAAHVVDFLGYRRSDHKNAVGVALRRV